MKHSEKLTLLQMVLTIVLQTVLMTSMTVNPDMYWCKNGDDSNDDCNDSDDDYGKYDYADDEDIDILKW